MQSAGGQALSYNKFREQLAEAISVPLLCVMLHSCNVRKVQTTMSGAKQRWALQHRRAAADHCPSIESRILACNSVIEMRQRCTAIYSYLSSIHAATE